MADIEPPKRPSLLLRIHHEYDLPQRGRVETADRGWVDWRKAKRLKRKGQFKKAPSYQERAAAFVDAYRRMKQVADQRIGFHNIVSLAE